VLTLALFLSLGCAFSLITPGLVRRASYPLTTMSSATFERLAMTARRCCRCCRACRGGRDQTELFVLVRRHELVGSWLRGTHRRATAHAVSKRSTAVADRAALGSRRRRSRSPIHRAGNIVRRGAVHHSSRDGMHRSGWLRRRIDSSVQQAQDCMLCAA
jgi:hypothetical protein